MVTIEKAENKSENNRTSSTRGTKTRERSYEFEIKFYWSHLPRAIRRVCCAWGRSWARGVGAEAEGTVSSQREEEEEENAPRRRKGEVNPRRGSPPWKDDEVEPREERERERDIKGKMRFRVLRVLSPLLFRIRSDRLGSDRVRWSYIPFPDFFLYVLFFFTN